MQIFCWRNFVFRLSNTTFVRESERISSQSSKQMTLKQFFRKIFSPLLIGNCLGFVLVSIILLVGGLIFLNKYTLHDVNVETPNVCGSIEDVAQRKLEALGFEVQVSDTGYVYSAAAFEVLGQSIAPGEKVKPGRLIKLTINADSPRQIAIPDVADNCSRREAEDKLRVLGFRLGATEYVDGDPEWVMGVKVNGRNVSAGTKVSITTPVTLVVGAGGMDYEYNGNDSLDYMINVMGEDDYFLDEDELRAGSGETNGGL